MMMSYILWYCFSHNYRSSDGLGGWTFTSARFWGEIPNGTWTLKLYEDMNGKAMTCDLVTSFNVEDFPRLVCKDKTERGGVLKEWMLTLYGSKVTFDDIQRRRQ